MPSTANFEDFMTVMIQVKVFWDVILCSMVVVYQHFRGPYCLHLQGEAQTSEMLVYYHNSTWHDNPEDLNLNPLY